MRVWPRHFTLHVLRAILVVDAISRSIIENAVARVSTPPEILGLVFPY